MAANGGSTALIRQIKKELVYYPLDSQQCFLPLNKLDELITEGNVKAAISFTKYMRDRKLPSRTVQQAKKVFAILILIGEPDAIRELIQEGLTDDHLPLSLMNDEENILVSPGGKTFASFAKWKTEQRVADFVDKQWILLAPVLDSSGTHFELHARCPLPFLSMDTEEHHRTNAVYKSEVHPAHHRVPQVHGNESKLQVAAKEFRNKADFTKERENLDIVRNINHEHLLQCFASCKKAMLYYIISPWADGGSMRDFWEKEDSRPRTNDVILWSLQQLLGLTKALEALHDENFRHGDLKPDNIFHFREVGQGKLVMADVGVSRKHDKDTQLRHAGTTTRATTPSYEAPETLKSINEPRGRIYDVWSLGCIFLEFAIWLMHDLEAINSFGHARNAPTFEFYLIRDKQPEIHPVAKTVINLLRSDIRCKGGTGLEAFINLVADDLLQVELDRRASAKDVVNRPGKIVQDAESKPSFLIHSVEQIPNKLRLPKRTQTGARPPENETIPE